MGADLHQAKTIAWFESQGEGPWTVINCSRSVDDVNLGVYCALSSPSRRDQALSEPEWDLTVTDAAPGFSQSWGEGNGKTTTYHPHGDRDDDDGVEPLVLVREFYGVRESEVELDQQFRLFHNLHYDHASRTYAKINDDGTHDVVVKVNNGEVMVRTPILRQYIAARQMDLLLFIDSAAWSDDPVDLPDEQTNRTSKLVAALRYSGEEWKSASVATSPGTSQQR